MTGIERGSSLSRMPAKVRAPTTIRLLFYYFGRIDIDLDDGNLVKKWTAKENLYPIRKLDQSKILSWALGSDGNNKMPRGVLQTTCPAEEQQKRLIRAAITRGQAKGSLQNKPFKQVITSLSILATINS
ncbi:hypothetical protein CFP56_025487 [Quercus suber]|uniref:Uncharacterized protein n=1 Tax=Quercus suber TaxID=58331 RepID=A0AAW0LXW0_QUESU